MAEMHRSLTEKVLDRAESDPEWRQLLIDDPELAMREANFPEMQQMAQGQQMGQGPQRPREREVVGQWWPGGGGYGYGGRGGYGYGYGRPQCRWHWSWRWGWYRSY